MPTVRARLTMSRRRYCGRALATALALGLAAFVAMPSGHAATLADELRELADEHRIVFKGLDKTESKPARNVDGTLDERLKGLLKDFNYIRIQSIGGGPERVVIMHRIGASVDGAIKPIATITRPNQGSIRPAPAVWTGNPRELDNLVLGAKVSSGYGMRYHPLLGYRVMHRGIDLAASRGMPIKALADGVIDWAGRNGAYGNYLRIRHDAMYQTAYGHLSRFVDGIGKGTRVQRGDVIGYVGSTGRSTGPHLHFELMVNGQRVNPMAEMAAFREGQGRALKVAHVEGRR